MAPLGSGGDAFHAVMLGPGGLRRPVALKLLRNAEPAHRDALAREARLGALLVHPNVVVAHDHGEHDGVPFVAMELVRGVPLRRLLDRGPLPPAAVVDVGRQVCAGLGAIHALGAAPLRTWGNAEDTWGNTFEDDSEGLAVPGGLVVHRDIRPETLLVEPTGLVRIADLGLARATRTAGRRGGTRGYMPPEQVHGLEDTRADLFALGATLAELALGQRLLPDGDDDGVLIDALGDLELSRLDDVVTGLATIVGRCLALDPDDRWASAPVLAEALEQLRPTPEPTLRGWVAAVVPPEHPPVEPVDGGNLPDPPEAFVGRAAELATLAGRLAEPGIVTLIGPPGIGKSRLALEAARSRTVAGGRWLAELTPTRSLDGVCHAVARALDLALGGEPPVLQLAHALAARGDLVMVLDGIDAVPAAVSEALEAWRRRAPRARFLCTGRRPLGLPGEEVLRLNPLAPGDAEALYAARAPGGAEDSAALVERLERLPLAIEVAAAGGGRVGPEAQGLRAALDGAWEALSEAERAALTQLTVFDGGFTLHAAEAVLALPNGHGWALDRIDTLVRARLVQRDPLHPDRYRMLALVRAWAGERLDPADRAAAEERHTRFFAQLGTPEALAVSDARRLAPELDNLLAAWKRARRPARRAALALAVGQLLRRIGPAARGEAILSEALAVPDLTSADTARLLRKRAQLLRLLGRTEPARASWAEALAISRSLPDPHHEAVSRLGLGHWFIGVQRTAEARPHLEAAMALVPTDPRLRAAALAGLSTCARTEGRLQEARAHADEVRQLATRLSDPRLDARAQLLLGNVASHAGDVAAARSCYEAARHAWEELGDRDAMATALANLGSLAQRQGRLDEARQLYLGALEVLKALGSRQWLGRLLLSLATLEEEVDDLDAALGHCREALAIAEETKDRRAPALIRGTLANLELEAGRPEAALRLLQGVLPELEVLDELATVGALQGVAGLAFAHIGRIEEARRWLARGRRLLEAHGHPDLLQQHQGREARVDALAISAGSEPESGG